MNRYRSQARIRPVRPYWPRSRVLVASLVVAVAGGVTLTSWLQRTEDLTIALASAGPVTVVTDAGPVAVVSDTEGGGRVDYRADWLVAGPVATIGLDADESVVRIGCDTRWPCRATTTVALADPRPLTVEADHDVLVRRFAGPLDVSARGGAAVLLGAVTGPVVATTETGPVVGHGLSAATVDVGSPAGEVELNFADRPERVDVRAGAEPVTIGLPPGNYAVTVYGGSSVAVDVDQAVDADSSIVVRASGPVRIHPLSDRADNQQVDGSAGG